MSTKIFPQLNICKESNITSLHNQCFIYKKILFIYTSQCFIGNLIFLAHAPLLLPASHFFNAMCVVSLVASSGFPISHLAFPFSSLGRARQFSSLWHMVTCILWGMTMYILGCVLPWVVFLFIIVGFLNLIVSFYQMISNFIWF